jgi:hypothetical protein
VNTLFDQSIDINQIKDELVSMADMFDRYTRIMLEAKLREQKAAYNLDRTRDSVEMNLREMYSMGKKPAEDQIKLEVRMDPRVVSAAEEYQAAETALTAAKYNVDIVARREGITRTLASLIKAELNSLD